MNKFGKAQMLMINASPELCFPIANGIFSFISFNKQSIYIKQASYNTALPCNCNEKDIFSKYISPGF